MFIIIDLKAHFLSNKNNSDINKISILLKLVHILYATITYLKITNIHTVSDPKFQLIVFTDY